ncbi:MULTISPECIES: glycoside hydrolase family 3 N-terminal domain-containing protein [unclassified Sphingobium]|uniref:glycoside hydrolase family 3 N-terminal domain-containing protein n=1 Tax=unclassified Sphingobium TaxID=2611147 RepID=UPI0007F3527C|nr:MULTISPECIES: glycoside hydrolase family 3 N-terminal domain-containing protein [unclassified Sphingobium]OAN52087.1 beta-glucosidase [Sphingobium sp. TCM1]WIW88589.1 glycoside hydrolase family 3 N-terminal domain-containing protein [Sphingobium sp. V4]
MTLDRRDLLIRTLGGAFALGLPRRALAQTDVERVDALISKMTIEEKAGQMTCLADSFRPFNPPNPQAGIQDEKRLAEEIRKGRVGCLFNGIGVAGARRAQDIAVRDSRLGIPLLFAGDVIHGLKTIFPVPLAEASSFDPDLCQRTARAMAVEATAAGLHLTFAPMVDVARDQRWGRVVEGAGEDVTLTGLLSAARIRGFQGRDLRRDDSLLACPKHFAAYGAVAAGLEYGNVDISEETLRETHLPPFGQAFAAGALTTMAAFNEINGVPATADGELLTDILRGEMQFRGFVFSDYTADEELVAHGFAEDARDAARLAVLAGVDMSMQSGLFIRYLPELVKSGAVPMGTVDVAVRRILYVKAAIGLFDNPYRSLNAEAEQTRIYTAAHRGLAREAAARSVVLLKNAGVLPIDPAKGQSIALIGPFAEDTANLYGPWAFYGDPGKGVDIATGLRAALPDAAKLSVTRGSDISGAIDGGIAQAVTAAKAADIVLLAIGESQAMSGEAQSRTVIDIPAAQQALADAVVATGKPVVILLRHGRALALHGGVADAQAILATWFLGSEAGHAIADILLGRVDPSGKLPVSFPWESGQEPFFYDRKSTGRPVVDDRTEYKARYTTTDNSARFPFGHGLSYTDFALDRLKLSDSALRWDSAIEITVRVTNAGGRKGSEVVQLYIRDRVASRTRPIRELKRMARVTLAPGDSRIVRFSLSRTDLEFVGARNRRIAEPGLFDLWVGSSSVGGLHAQFTLYADMPAPSPAGG